MNDVILRQLALMQHLDEEYFFIEDVGKKHYFKGNFEEVTLEYIEDVKDSTETVPLLAWLLDNKDVEEYDYQNDKYMVLTDEEADEHCKEHIKDTIWAFNAEFILDTCGLDYNSKVAEYIHDMQANLCEDSNDFLLSLVEGTCGLDKFVEEAISSNSRGHYLASYDGEEHEETVEGETFYIYRIG